MSYLDKYKGYGDSKSVYDILSLNPNNKTHWENEIKPKYVATDIEKVVIGGNTFKNYGDFQFAWEKSYVKSPERSADGSIGNLNSYATFVTPHLIINFSIMSIDDYRKIMRLDLESNEFVVECYDPIYNKKFKGKMYFATPQMAKLLKLAKIRFDGDRWEEFVELVGVQEYTVELIGTNADLDLVSVRYIVNAPEGEAPTVKDGGEDDVYQGEELVIGGNTDIPTETFGGRYKFSHWEDESGQKYINGYAYTINQSLVLYAQWNKMSNYTLVFNYGLGDDFIANGAETSRQVNTQVPIGNLPVAPTPIVKAKNQDGVEEEYRPYTNGQWYKSPKKETGGEVLTANTPYWLNRDGAAYLLYDTNRYYITFYVYSEQKGEYRPLVSSGYAEYDTKINFPILEKEGYSLDGWYKSVNLESDTKFSGNMTPYNLSLYARWVKE